MRALILMLAALLPAAGADREFKDIVAAISDHYGARPTRIPMFGLVNAFAFVARPAGARHIDLAVFEDLNGRMDPDVVKRLVGRNWTPFVQTHSKRSGESTMIFVRGGGSDTRMLITTIESREATVIEVRLNVDTLRRWLDDPRHAGLKEH